MEINTRIKQQMTEVERVIEASQTKEPWFARPVKLREYRHGHASFSGMTITCKEFHWE